MAQRWPFDLSALNFALIEADASDDKSADKRKEHLAPHNREKRERKRANLFKADPNPTHKYKPRGRGSGSCGRERGRGRGRGRNFFNPSGSNPNAFTPPPPQPAAPPLQPAAPTVSNPPVPAVAATLVCYEKTHKLKRSPLYRNRLFYAPTSVHPERDGVVIYDAFLPEMGLYTAVDISAGEFVAFYTGNFFTNVQINAMPGQNPERFARLQSYMLDLAGTDVTIAPEPDSTSGKIEPNTHVAATMNEPNKGIFANVFANTHTFEVPDEDGIIKRVKAVCLYTCADVPAYSELLYHYGTGRRMVALRAQLGYTPGRACPTNQMNISKEQDAITSGRAIEIAEDVALADQTLYDLENRGDDSD